MDANELGSVWDRTPPNAGHHLGETVEKTLANRKKETLRFAEGPEPFRTILAETLNPSPVERIESVSKRIRLLS